MARTVLGGRILLSRRFAALAIGDLLAVVVFAVLGEYRHAGTALSVIETTLQFGVGWLVVAPLLGAYAPGAIDRWPRAGLRGAGTWMVAAVVGALVRSLTEPGATLSAVFVLVTVGVGAVILATWRVSAAIGLGER